jgi:hypothetical protein
MAVKILPALNWDIGLPQQQRAAISVNGGVKAFTFHWYWNDVGETSVLMCRIEESQKVIWRGAVSLLYPFEVRGVDDADLQFTMMVRALTRTPEYFKVWIFED